MIMAISLKTISKRHKRHITMSKLLYNYTFIIALVHTRTVILMQVALRTRVPNLVYGLSMHYADVVAVIDMVTEMSLKANTSRFIKKG